MSQARERDLQMTQGGPVLYRPAPNLRIKTGARDVGGSRTHFIRSRDGLTQLGEEEYFIFCALDGISTFAEIESEFRARFAGDLSRPQFHSLIDELLETGIIESVAPVDAEPQSVPPVAAPLPEPVAETAERAAPSGTRSAARISPALLLCARLGATLRHFVWLLIPATALAGALLWTGRPLLAQTEGAAASTGAGWLSLDILFVAGLVLVVPTIAKAGVAAFHGAPWDALRPVGSAARSANPVRIAGLPRKGVVWTYAAPLLALLAVFLAGTFLWAAQEDPKSQTAVAALVVGLVGLVAFLLGAIPLWPGPGRRFIAAYVAGASSGRGQDRGFMIGAGVIGAAVYDRLRQDEPRAVAATAWRGLGRGRRNTQVQPRRTACWRRRLANRPTRLQPGDHRRRGRRDRLPALSVRVRRRVHRDALRPQHLAGARQR